MEGSITIESEENVGTEVVFKIRIFEEGKDLLDKNNKNTIDETFKEFTEEVTVNLGNSYKNQIR